MEFPIKEAALNFLGDPPDDFRKPLKWDWEWLEDGSGPSIFKELGIYGMNIPNAIIPFALVVLSI